MPGLTDGLTYGQKWKTQYISSLKGRDKFSKVINCQYMQIYIFIELSLAMRKPVLIHMRTASKGEDQPAHLHSLISAFVVRCQDSIIPLVAKSKIPRLLQVSVTEQVDLSLLKTGFLMMWLTKISILGMLRFN